MMGNNISHQVNRTAVKMHYVGILVQEAVSAQTLPRKQILIVDDEIFNIEAAKVVLECRLGLNYAE